MGELCSTLIVMEGRWTSPSSIFCLLILSFTCDSKPLFNTGALYFMDVPKIKEYGYSESNRGLGYYDPNPRTPSIAIKPPAPKIADEVNEREIQSKSRNLLQKLQFMMVAHLSRRNSNLQFAPSDEVKIHFFRVH